MEILKLIVENYQAIITAVVAILTGVIAIAMIIPGPQPEKMLTKIVEFISKFSSKPGK